MRNQGRMSRGKEKEGSLEEEEGLFRAECQTDVKPKSRECIELEPRKRDKLISKWNPSPKKEKKQDDSKGVH